MHLPPQPVTYDAERGLWLLTTPDTGYLLREDPDGSPRHVAWGTLEDVAALAEAGSLTQLGGTDSFHGGEAADELGIETGTRFGPAGLQVRFADGTRGAQWGPAGNEIDDRHGGLG